MRWSPDGRVLGTPELTTEVLARIEEAAKDPGWVAVTPTGPFPKATIKDPAAVAAVAWQVLRDLGFEGKQIGGSPAMPRPPALPEGAVG